VEDSFQLHRAPWVLPIADDPIKNGAVVVGRGRIHAVGSYSNLKNSFAAAKVIDHEAHVLLPSLVNAHTHLELSHLAHLSMVPPPSLFTHWIEQLLAERVRLGFAGEAVVTSMQQALEAQQDDGVIALADISNTGISRQLAADFWGMLFCFKEFYGLALAGNEKTLVAIDHEKDQHCTAHAPYSTHATLLTRLKLRANQLGHVFPIHVAEPASESEMMSRGRGEIPVFLAKRGFWDGSFQPTGIDNSGSVQYLNQLGLLDAKTLCVHCVHVPTGEQQILQQSGCSVCLCPGSNSYLGVGKAPVLNYLKLGITLALGTDSLASNPSISLWREMRILADDHPEVAPSAIVAMATRGGSEALGIFRETGSLEPGKQAAFLAVYLPEACRTADKVHEILVSFKGRPELKRVGVPTFAKQRAGVH